MSKFLTHHEDTEDSESNRSAIHDGKTWLIPETSNSEPDIASKREGKQDQHGQKGAEKVKTNDISNSK